jgi:hypothetical protein
MVLIETKLTSSMPSSHLSQHAFWHAMENRMTDDKVKENRVRRLAQRRGLDIVKSRRRDPAAVDYKGYMLVDPNRNFAVLGGQPFAYSSSLDEIENYFSSEEGSAARWVIGKVQETSFSLGQPSMPGCGSERSIAITYVRLSGHFDGRKSARRLPKNHR